ncbi:Oidioi.mRNA.OKI2018_I69.XSR.g13285.t1.cds [Oikopleura dioica]|uniref:Oidioi.mRNA.OKI2018_I69.XSR.g13285.t1.cds n=1 Tax=Oikopleura dioica TaxID=34765 RepID=A0ABN7SB36_OIKDI|nr:Oidioi.mRNA.OKI2018_I69.XSR.g13285.t1.cds [Oikopleura dioica]
MKILYWFSICAANAADIVKGNDGRVVSRINKYGAFRKNVGAKKPDVEPTVDYMAMHNPGLAEELAKIMDSANANDAEYMAKKRAKEAKRKPPKQLLGAPGKGAGPKRGPPMKRPGVNLKSAGGGGGGGGMTDQERRREEQRIRDEMEKSKADAEFQVVKGYAIKGAIGIGVIAALMIVVTKIRTAMEEKAKQQKLAEERAAAAAEKVKPAEPTPADLKALEDEEGAKKEAEREKIYDSIDSDDQKKIDELYEKKPISS